MNHVVEHHTSLWACHEHEPTGVAPDAWNCGGHPPPVPQPQFQRIGPCLGGTGFQFFPINTLKQGPISLPPGVGIEIGTDFESITFATHYTKVVEAGGWTGGTGLTIDVEKVPVTEQPFKKASTLTMYVWGWIKAQSHGQVQGTFAITEDVVIHPFAVVFHAHAMSRRAIVTKISPDATETEILNIEADLHKDGTYHLLDSNVTFASGDKIRAACTFENTLNTTLRVE